MSMPIYPSDAPNCLRCDRQPTCKHHSQLKQIPGEYANLVAGLEIFAEQHTKHAGEKYTFPEIMTTLVSGFTFGIVAYYCQDYKERYNDKREAAVQEPD